MSGWVKVHRKIMENAALSGDARRLGVFVWLLVNAAWKPTQTDVRGATATIERGQVCVSLRRLADECGLTLKVVRSILERLKSDTIVGTETVNGRTLITICNFDKYQAGEDAEGTSEGTERGKARAQQGHLKEEGKKGKKAKNSPDGEGARERASRLPKDWALPRAWGEWALGQGVPEDRIRFEADKFKDYYIAQPGQKGTRTDWFATWRNWVRKDLETKQRKEVSHGRPTTRRAEFWRAYAEAEDAAEGDDRGPASGLDQGPTDEGGPAYFASGGDVVPLFRACG